VLSLVLVATQPPVRPPKRESAAQCEKRCKFRQWAGCFNGKRQVYFPSTFLDVSDLFLDLTFDLFRFAVGLQAGFPTALPVTSLTRLRCSWRCLLLCLECLISCFLNSFEHDERRPSRNVGESLQGSYGVLPYELTRRSFFIVFKAASGAERGHVARAPADAREQLRSTLSSPSAAGSFSAHQTTLNTP